MKLLRRTLAAFATGLMLTFAAQAGVAAEEGEAVEVTYIQACCPELLSKVGDGSFQAARSISFSPSLNLTPSTISARR